MKRLFGAPGGADPLVRGGALDALRFLAAALIVLYHYAEQAPAALGDLHPALTRAHLATDFFLMLSGYVLARAYGAKLQDGRLQAGPFFLHRISRVWPAHLLVLAAIAGLLVTAGYAGVQVNNAAAFDWRALPAHALLVQAWGLGVAEGWNWPTWSLSALIVCYALFPLVWAVLGRLSATGALLLALAAVAAADLTARAFGQNFYDLPPAIGVLRAVPLFAFGAALARYGAPAGLSLTGARILGCSAAVLIVALQLIGQFDAVSVALIGVVMLAAGARTPPRPSKLVARAAELSFALYVTHSLSGMVWYRSLDLALPGALEGGGAWLVWATGFPVAVFVAFLFHRIIDAPLQAWLNQRLKAPRQPRPLAVGA